MQTTDIEILKGLISLIKVNNGKFSDTDIALLKGIYRIVNDRWITIHPHGYNSDDYRRIKLIDGETPEEAIKRVYKTRPKKKSLEKDKNIKDFAIKKKEVWEKWEEAEKIAEDELKKAYNIDVNRLSESEINSIFEKIDKLHDNVDKFQKEYNKILGEESKYIVDNSTPLKDNEPIAGVKKGKPMDFEKANGGNVNPNYNPFNYEYSHNCQSCVVAYEARRRGYDVQVVERGEYDKTAQLAEHSFWAFMDPKTNKVCEPEIINAKNSINLYNLLNSKVKPNERYVFAYNWDNGKITDGHIQIVERNRNGDLLFYDPQSGIKISNKERAINYLKNKDILFGKNTPQELLRIDDKQFNTYFINDIVRKN